MDNDKINRLTNSLDRLKNSITYLFTGKLSTKYLDTVNSQINTLLSNVHQSFSLSQIHAKRIQKLNKLLELRQQIILKKNKNKNNELKKIDKEISEQIKALNKDFDLFKIKESEYKLKYNIKSFKNQLNSIIRSIRPPNIPLLYTSLSDVLRLIKEGYSDICRLNQGYISTQGILNQLNPTINQTFSTNKMSTFFSNYSQFLTQFQIDISEYINLSKEAASIGGIQPIDISEVNKLTWFALTLSKVNGVAESSTFSYLKLAIQDLNYDVNKAIKSLKHALVVNKGYKLTAEEVVTSISDIRENYGYYGISLETISSILSSIQKHFNTSKAAVLGLARSFTAMSISNTFLSDVILAYFSSRSGNNELEVFGSPEEMGYQMAKLSISKEGALKILNARAGVLSKLLETVNDESERFFKSYTFLSKLPELFGNLDPEAITRLSLEIAKYPDKITQILQTVNQNVTAPENLIKQEDALRQQSLDILKRVNDQFEILEQQLRFSAGAHAGSLLEASNIVYNLSLKFINFWFNILNYLTNKINQKSTIKDIQELVRTGLDTIKSFVKFFSEAIWPHISEYFNSLIKKINSLTYPNKTVDLAKIIGIIFGAFILFDFLKFILSPVMILVKFTVGLIFNILTIFSLLSFTFKIILKITIFSFKLLGLIIKGIFKLFSVIPIISKFLSIISKIIIDFFTFLKNKIFNLIQYISNAIKTLLTTIKNIFYQAFKNFEHAIKNIIKNFITKAIDFIRSIGSKVTLFFKGAKEIFLKFLKNLISITSRLTSSFSKLTLSIGVLFRQYAVKILPFLSKILPFLSRILFFLPLLFVFENIKNIFAGQGTKEDAVKVGEAIGTVIGGLLGIAISRVPGGFFVGAIITIIASIVGGAIGQQLGAIVADKLGMKSSPSKDINSINFKTQEIITNDKIKTESLTISKNTLKKASLLLEIKYETELTKNLCKSLDLYSVTFVKFFEIFQNLIDRLSVSFTAHYKIMHRELKKLIEKTYTIFENIKKIILEQNKSILNILESHIDYINQIKIIKETEISQASASFVSSKITSDFGAKRGDKIHKGIDIVPLNFDPNQSYSILHGLGKDVIATVIETGEQPGGWGKYVLLEAFVKGKKIRARYAHLKEIHVKKGQKIGATSSIGFLGSTGRSSSDHLHTEIEEEGEIVDPKEYINIKEVIGFITSQLQSSQSTTSQTQSSQSTTSQTQSSQSSAMLNNLIINNFQDLINKASFIKIQNNKLEEFDKPKAQDLKIDLVIINETNSKIELTKVISGKEQKIEINKPVVIVNANN